MQLEAVAVIALGCLAALVVSSYAVEALRRRPSAPDKLLWGPDLSIEYASLAGIKVR